VKRKPYEVTNRNYNHEEIKRRLNSGNVWYFSVQNTLLFCPLSKNVRIETQKIIILPIVLYERGTD
jgi:hypothetical protein